MRVLALMMKDTAAFILMNDLAADYDKLADKAAYAVSGSKPLPNGKPNKPPQLAALSPLSKNKSPDTRRGAFQN
jgi:hypothetical protein